jgi:hypothetical protein
MEKEYNNQQFEIGNQLRDELANQTVDGRVMANFTVLLATVKILKDLLPFPFKYEELYAKSKEYILTQSELISISDELAEFFGMLEYLSLTHAIRINEDYLIKEDLHDIKVGRGDKSEVRAVSGKKLLFIRMAKVFPLYKESIRKQGLQGLDQQTIISYMKTHKAYIGDVKTARFGHDSTSAFVFDYTLLNITLKNEVDHHQATPTVPAPPSPKPNYGVQTELKDDGLPF